MAPAAVRTKGLVLLLLIICLLLLPLFVRVVLSPWFVVQYFALQSSRWEEKAGCFTVIVTLMSCNF